MIIQLELLKYYIDSIASGTFYQGVYAENLKPKFFLQNNEN